jgi:hypothetical protein
MDELFLECSNTLISGRAQIRKSMRGRSLLLAIQVYQALQIEFRYLLIKIFTVIVARVSREAM